MSTLFKRRKRPIVEAVGQLLLLMSFIAAVLYGGGWYPSEGLWPVIVKGSAVSLLALFVLISMQSVNHFLLLLAYQHETDRGERSRMIAANNIVNSGFMAGGSLLAAALIAFGLTTTDVLLIAGIANLLILPPTRRLQATLAN